MPGDLLPMLKALAEPTRLRIVSLLAQGEMTVSEIMQVLGQSQPRVSRHLKLLADAGLCERFPEGGWVLAKARADWPEWDKAMIGVVQEGGKLWLEGETTLRYDTQLGLRREVIS